MLPLYKKDYARPLKDAEGAIAAMGDLIGQLQGVSEVVEWSASSKVLTVYGYPLSVSTRIVKGNAEDPSAAGVAVDLWGTGRLSDKLVSTIRFYGGRDVQGAHKKLEEMSSEAREWSKDMWNAFTIIHSAVWRVYEDVMPTK